MQFMLVLRTAICTNVFKNTETQKPHFTDWFFVTCILWPQGILRRILLFKEVYKQISLPTL